MLGQTPYVTADSPCPTCRPLQAGPFTDSAYPFPDCKCPEGFEKQEVQIKNEQTDELQYTYTFCKPKGGSCIGKKASPNPLRKIPDVLPPKRDIGPNWLMILGGIGVAGLLIHRYRSLR